MTQGSENSTTLFVEIGAEDLPPLAESDLFFSVFDSSLVTTLEKHGCKPATKQSEREKVYSVSTPRRFAIFTPLVTPERIRRGPAMASAYSKDGEPTPALEGFLRSHGAKEKDLVKDCVYKGRNYVGLRFRINLREQIGAIIEEAIEAAILPRKMRWISDSGHPYKFIRRITSASIYVGGEFVSTKIFGIATSREVIGHRFSGSGKLAELDERASWEDYLKLLEKSGVMGKAKDRKEALDAAAKNYTDGGKASNDELVAQLAQMCEYPAPVQCSFDKKYLELPPAVIKEVGNKHLRVFTNLGGEFGEQNKFLFIADRYSPTKKLVNQIRRGVEKVMAARLDDALFLYEQDKNMPEVEMVLREKNASVTYIDGLGSIAGRCERISKLAEKTSSLLGLPDDSVKAVAKAASLCKLDFGTQTVGELPGVEGKIVGKIINLDNDVVASLLETYAERRLDGTSSLPRASLVIAHELERLAANIAVLDRRATGDGDPSGIRRSVNRICDVLAATTSQASPVIAKEFDLYGLVGASLDLVAKDAERITLKHGETKAERFKVANEDLCLLIRDALYRRDTQTGRGAQDEEHERDVGYVNQVMMKGRPPPGGISCALDLLLSYKRTIYSLDRSYEAGASLFVFDCIKRVRSLNRFVLEHSNSFVELGRVIKRLAHISSELKREPVQSSGKVERKFLEKKAEKELYEKCKGFEEKCDELRNDGSYLEMLVAANKLVPLVDGFFEEVMINDSDEKIRNNRLALVKFAHDQILRFAKDPNGN